MASNQSGYPYYAGHAEDGGFQSYSSKRFGIDRAAVDYMSSVIPWLGSSVYRLPSKNKEILRNNPQWARQVLPLIASSPSSNDGVCNFLAYSSINKSRSPSTLIKWFPDGRKLLSGTLVGELAIWSGVHFNFEDIKRLPLGGGAVTALEFSPEEDRLYAGDSVGQVMALSLALNPLENQAFEGLSHQIRDLSLSPFGNKLAACADACNPIIWDVETRDIERYLRAQHVDTNNTVCLKWHPDKALVGTCSGINWLHLWDPRTSQPVASTQAHNRALIALRWNFDGQQLLTSGKDGLLKLWDLRYLKTVTTFRCAEPQASVPSDATTGDTSAPKSVIEPLSIGWNPVQNHIFVAGDAFGGLWYWSTHQSDKPLCYIRKAHGGQQRNEKEPQIVSLDWHPMGHLLATSANDRQIRFWSRGPPGCVAGEVIDAQALCEIEKTGSFPMSSDSAQTAHSTGVIPSNQAAVTSIVAGNESRKLSTFSELRNKWLTASNPSNSEPLSDSWLDGFPKPKHIKNST